MQDIHHQQQECAPLFRAYLLGPFVLEQRIASGTPGSSDAVYEVVSFESLSQRRQVQRFFAVLLARPGRRARRGFLMDLFWPGTDPELAGQYLNQTVAKLRKVLSLVEGGEYLVMTEGGGYAVASQEQLWVDVDAVELLLLRARQESAQTLSLVEEVVRLLRRGEFLEEEEGTWVLGRRGRLEDERKSSRVWLAQLLAQQGRVEEGEGELRAVLEEDPTDEVVLCALMELLHGHGMSQKALRCYEATRRMLAKEGVQPAAATRALAERIRMELPSSSTSSSSSVIQSASGVQAQENTSIQHSEAFPSIGRTSNSELLNPTSTPLSIPSLLRTDVDVLARLSIALSKPSIVSEREINYFDQQTRLYWRAREETALPSTTLYAYSIRHIDDINTLLARSHLPILRTYLCEIICRTVLLAGILLYDMGQYVKARQQYQVAFQAATEANNPVLQAIVWGWMSFTWTYTKHYIKALRCAHYARSFAMQTTDTITQAWLGAIESEIQAHLYNRDACLQALSDMERGIGVSPSQDTSYLFEFNPVLLLGYKGVCLQQFYQRQMPTTHGFLQEAKEALEQALASEAPVKRKLYYLNDLAGIYARQGEVETACTSVAQSIPLIKHLGSGSKTIREHLLQVRLLLQPYKDTFAVQTLDEQIAPLLIGM